MLGTLPSLVSQLCPHEHVFEIHPQRLSEAHHLDHSPVRLCVAMVSLPCLFGANVSYLANPHPCP